MISIRLAQDSDVESLYRLIEELGNAKPVEYFETNLAEQKLGKRHLYLIEHNQILTGYGILNWQPRYSLYKKLNIPEVQDLNITPAKRRQGFATAFIEFCENELRKNNVDMIGISVGLTKDYGPAQRLYFKLGFEPDGCGVSYDRSPVSHGEMHPVDDNLCLMMIKSLK